jgi:dolichol kinase
MELRHEAGRKAIHVALAILPVTAWALSRAAPRLVQMVLVLLAAGALVFDWSRRRHVVVKKITNASVGPLIRRTEENRILGSTFYFLALAASFVFFPATWALAAMGFLVVGDAAAALVGRAIGRREIRPGKTLEGSLACLAGCVVVAFAVGAVDSAARIAVLLPGAVAATAGELLTDGDHDNLAVPLLSGAVMWLTARSL